MKVTRTRKLLGWKSYSDAKVTWMQKLLGREGYMDENVKCQIIFSSECMRKPGVIFPWRCEWMQKSEVKITSSCKRKWKPNSHLAANGCENRTLGAITSFHPQSQLTLNLTNLLSHSSTTKVMECHTCDIKNVTKMTFNSCVQFPTSNSFSEGGR